MKKRKGSKYYFYQYLFNFMCTLFVPVLAMGLIYARAESTVRRQVIVSSTNALNRFFNTVDAKAESMRNICIGVANTDECIAYAAFLGTPGVNKAYQGVKTMNALREFRQEGLYDVFVYYPEDNLIISGFNGSLKPKYYYDSYYYSIQDQKKGDGCWEEFQSMIQYSSKKPEFFVLNPGKDRYLCMAVRHQGNNGANSGYVAVVVLQPNFMEELFGEEDEVSENILMMFNQKEEILLSSDERFDSYHLAEKGGEDFYQVKVDGERYLMKDKPSKKTEAYYVAAIPEDYFWHQLSELRFYCGISILICVIASILIAYHNTVRSYQPIAQMMKYLKEQTRADFGTNMQNEFDYVEKILQKEIDEKELLEKKMKRSRDAFQEKFLFSLLNGTRSVSDQGEDIFQENGITLCSDRFCTCIMNMNSKDGENRDDIRPFVVKNVFIELCEGEVNGYVIPLSGGCYILWVNLLEGKEEKLFQILEQGSDFLKKYYQWDIAMGVSRVQEGVFRIPETYREAQEALRYEYLFGKNSIIRYDAIAQRTFQYPSFAESRLSRLIMEYLTEGADKEGAKELTRQIKEQYGLSEEMSIETMECFKFEAVNVLNRAVISCDCSQAERKELLEAPLNKKTFEEFMTHFESLLELLYEKKKEKTSENNICYQVKEYIEAQYQNPELSVTMIGEDLRLPAAQISSMFRNQYGISLPNYISGVRIGHAKNLLKETDQSIQEIADKTGFLSSTVFGRTFKKMEGITPTMYRELTQAAKEEEQ